VLTTLGPEVARRPVSRRAITDAVGTMVEALARCMPGADAQQPMAALSTLVGAVVLARIADDPALAEAFLRAAQDSVLPAD
jgi:TetR/AcrR family transcriptional repressor of nem operon